MLSYLVWDLKEVGGEGSWGDISFINHYYIYLYLLLLYYIYLWFNRKKERKKERKEEMKGMKANEGYEGKNQNSQK